MDAQELICPWMGGIQRAHGCAGAYMLKSQASTRTIAQEHIYPKTKSILVKQPKNLTASETKTTHSFKIPKNNSYIYKTLRIK